MTPRDENELVIERKLHHLATRQQRPRGLLARDHEMAEPRAETGTGIVLGIADLGGCPQRIGDPFGGPFVVGGKAHPDMTVVEDRLLTP